MLIRALLLSPDPTDGARLCASLNSEDVQVVLHTHRDSLWEALRTGPVDLLAIEFEALPHSLEAFVDDVRTLPDAPEVVVFVRNSDPEIRARLQAARAFAIIDRAVTKREGRDAWFGIVDRLTEQVHRGWMAEQWGLDSNLGDFASESAAMREFLSFVRKVVDSESTLLIQGETGSGKEYLARAIHAESPRSACPFVPVHCSALSESLLESELFGHVEGAFTGATRGRKGYFEMAHRGTLFLDEVGELTPHVQVKLLRVIQDKRVQAVGAEAEVAVDGRLMAATNRDLAEEVRAGRFRADLYYRLSVVPLHLPPLRERKEDIPRMFESHVEEFCIAMNKNIEGVLHEALELLMAHRWPGNVRELINVAERAVLLCETHRIGPRDLPEEIRYPQGASAESALRSGAGASVQDPLSRFDSDPKFWMQPFRQAREAWLDPFEREYWERILRQCHGRVGDAAKLAGVSTRSLYARMQVLGLRKEAFYLR